MAKKIYKGTKRDPGKLDLWQNIKLVNWGGKNFMIVDVSCQSNDQKSVGGVITTGNVASTSEISIISDDGLIAISMSADARSGYDGNTAHEVFPPHTYTLLAEDLRMASYFDGIITATNYPLGIIGTGGRAMAFVPLSLIKSPLTVILSAHGQKVTEGPVTNIADAGASFGFGKASPFFAEGFEITSAFNLPDFTPLTRPDPITGDPIEVTGGGGATHAADGVTSVSRQFRFYPDTKITEEI